MTIRANTINFSVVTRAQIDVARAVRHARPDIRLLCVEELREARREHERARVCDGDAVRFTMQEFRSGIRLPDNRLRRQNRNSESCENDQ